MSYINVDEINENFPIQGQDNPSQGFRNNFAAIKKNLITARDELDLLETTTAQGVRIESGINPKTTITNDITLTDTQINVSDVTFFPSSGKIIIDNEEITYQNKISANPTADPPVRAKFINCTRGYDFWVNNKIYAQNERVVYDGRVYNSKFSNNLNRNPLTSSNFWAQLSETPNIRSPHTAGAIVSTKPPIIYNDFQNNVIQNAITQNISMGYTQGPTDLSGTSVSINVQAGQVQKIGIKGNATLNCFNWPEPTIEGICYKFTLHVKFNFEINDLQKYNYKVKFTTAGGGIIKSNDKLKYEILNNKYTYFFQPTIDSTLASITNEELLNVAVTNTTGSFSCTSTSIIPFELVTVTGVSTNNVLGAHTYPRTFLIFNTNNTTSFQLVNLDLTPLTTIVGPTTGLTFKKHSNTTHVNDYEYVFDIWSYDGGDTVFINNLGRFIGI